MKKLKEIYCIPPGFESLQDITQIAEIIPEPTLIHLAGERENPLFISVLLHGNEDTGFLALQKLLNKYQGKTLPRAITIFMGNIAAASRGVRRLDGQPDYNRVWPGTDHPECEETHLMQQVVDAVAARKPFASIDMHNNTGKNPHYGCINFLDNRFQQMAVLFSRTVVYFQTPKGVQSMAMAQYCPSITVECGKPHLPHGVAHAFDFLDTILHLDEIPNVPVHPRDIDIFHTVARVTIPDSVSFAFSSDPSAADLTFDPAVDTLNFSELPIGAVIGYQNKESRVLLQVWNEDGREVTAEYLALEAGKLVLTRPVMPSMLTLDERVIRQDCLCYLMERLEPDELSV